MASLLKRPEFLVENIIKTKEISLKSSSKLLLSGEDGNILLSGGKGKILISGAIDVEAKVPKFMLQEPIPKRYY